MQSMNTKELNAKEQPSDKSISSTRSRMMGLLVLVVIFGPMLAAYLIFKSGLGIPTGTINKGDLLPVAKSVTELDLRDIEGSSLNILVDKKWRLLLPAPQVCGSVCKKNLYTTRQVHIRLGEKARRLDRVYLLQSELTAADAEIQTARIKEHPRMQYAVVDKVALEKLLHSEITAERDIYQRYYLMDQEGFIMMSYGLEHEGNELLKDIKRMLKYSYEER